MSDLGFVAFQGAVTGVTLMIIAYLIRALSIFIKRFYRNMLLNELEKILGKKLSEEDKKDLEHESNRIIRALIRKS